MNSIFFCFGFSANRLIFFLRLAEFASSLKSECTFHVQRARGKGSGREEGAEARKWAQNKPNFKNTQTDNNRGRQSTDSLRILRYPGIHKELARIRRLIPIQAARSVKSATVCLYAATASDPCELLGLVGDGVHLSHRL